MYTEQERELVGGGGKKNTRKKKSPKTVCVILQHILHSIRVQWQTFVIYLFHNQDISKNQLGSFVVQKWAN